MNSDEIKELVRHRYGAFAKTGGRQEACCASMAQPASGYATELGLYSPEELALLPEGGPQPLPGVWEPHRLCPPSPGRHRR